MKLDADSMDTVATIDVVEEDAREEAIMKEDDEAVVNDILSDDVMVVEKNIVSDIDVEEVEENDDVIEDTSERGSDEIVEKKNKQSRLQSSVPLIIPKGISRSGMLIQLNKPIDVTGDVGIIGRFKVVADEPTSGKVNLDLKGKQFEGTILPTTTHMVVNLSKDEAKAEAIFTDFIDFNYVRNEMDAERLTAGILDDEEIRKELIGAEANVRGGGFEETIVQKVKSDDLSDGASSNSDYEDEDEFASSTQDRKRKSKKSKNLGSKRDKAASGAKGKQKKKQKKRLGPSISSGYQAKVSSTKRKKKS